MVAKFKAHPRHGIDTYGEGDSLHAFIEIVPTDTVKYEIDKDSGYLMIDRPQKFSNIVPALYGFVPKTYCGEHIANRCMDSTGLDSIVGDGDPLDICVLTERDVTHGDILVKVIPIGGFRMIDGGEADDKIIAVLANDEIYKWDDISECPEALINRLKHYFLTYKQDPGGEEIPCSIPEVYGAAEAKKVIEASVSDYKAFIS
ncbi:inorganic pyrophosphatase [Flavobacteriales bacterium]|nr:inorganic pyrophosphatase [Flavobacteriales bacterium]